MIAETRTPRTPGATVALYKERAPLDIDRGARAGHRSRRRTSIAPLWPFQLLRFAFVLGAVEIASIKLRFVSNSLERRFVITLPHILTNFAFVDFVSIVSLNNTQAAPRYSRRLRNNGASSIDTANHQVFKCKRMSIAPAQALHFRKMMHHRPVDYSSLCRGARNAEEASSTDSV